MPDSNELPACWAAPLAGDLFGARRYTAAMSGGVWTFNARALLTSFGLAFTVAGCFSVGDDEVGVGETAGDGDGDPSTGDGDPSATSC
jgi:hypothetical protein